MTLAWQFVHAVLGWNAEVNLCHDHTFTRRSGKFHPYRGADRAFCQRGRNGCGRRAGLSAAEAGANPAPAQPGTGSIGAMRDDAELLDQVTQSIMQARRTRTLRVQPDE